MYHLESWSYMNGRWLVSERKLSVAYFLPEITASASASPPLKQIYYHHYSFLYVVLGNNFMWKCHLFQMLITEIALQFH